MPTEITQAEIIWRLALACLLGGLIGLERESHRRPAGFRTHILVSVGSCLVMILSIHGFGEFETATRDPARLAAQVVSGIGFLGAGTIFREGLTVKGLTTAASLWVVAGIGLAVGSGAYLAATVTTAMVVVVLIALDRVEKSLIYTKQNTLFVAASDKPGQLGAIATALGRFGVGIKGVDMEFVEQDDEARIHLSLELPANVPREKLIEEISHLPGVHEVKYGH
ncbi:MAG: MgtC/SapB family protein [Firmicutes bacterium]|nr:MgtC/SapB family protein [Bacillota bacterium]